MKIVGSVKEDLNSERRISITPDTVKKLIDLNFSVFIEKNYGSHLGLSDQKFKNKGAILKNSTKEVLESAEMILKVNLPTNEEINFIKEKSKQTKKTISSKEADELIKEHHETHEHVKEEELEKPKKTAKLSKKTKKIRKK